MLLTGFSVAAHQLWKNAVSRLTNQQAVFCIQLERESHADQIETDDTVKSVADKLIHCIFHDHRIVLDTETPHLDGWELVDNLLATFIVDVSRDQTVRYHLYLDGVSKIALRETNRRRCALYQILRLGKSRHGEGE